MTDKDMPRIAPLPVTERSPDVAELLSRLPGGPAPLNIFTTLARHPQLLQSWLKFGGHVLGKNNTLSPRARELLILRTGHLCGCAYEFHQHRALALAAGLTEDEISSIAGDGSQLSGVEADLLTAADELYDQRRISDATWQRLASALSEQQLLDLLFTVGQYTLVALVLNSIEIQLEDSGPATR